MKLTEEQERWLLMDFRGGFSVSECMREYEITRSGVEEIIRKELIRIEKEKGK